MNLEGATLLIVEDDPMLRDAIAFDFRRQKYNVLTAGSGSEALSIVNAERVHLVVSDIRMSDGDGLNLLLKFRELESPRPQVILITGFLDLTADQALELGARAVFTKPFDRKVIAREVRKILSEL